MQWNTTHPQAKFEVFINVQVWKQGITLKDHADAAFGR